MSKKILVIIPARGGSKGLPRKNIRDLIGKPLIMHTVDAVRSIKNRVELVVSTDSAEIKKICESNSVRVSDRPKELSTDTSLVIDAVKYTITNEEKRLGFKFDVVVLLEPTSPLRTPEMIDECLDTLIFEDVASVATYCETDIPPTRVWSICDNVVTPYITGSDPWLPRQKHLQGYQLSGVFYGVLRNCLMEKNGMGFISPPHHAKVFDRRVSIDIDTVDDFDYVSYLMSRR